MNRSFSLGLAFAATILGVPVTADTFAPSSVLPSDLRVVLTEVGTVAPPDWRNNFNSPLNIGDDLYFINQRGTLLRQTASGFETLLDLDTRPTGVTGTDQHAFLNFAGDTDHVFVAFTSSTLPSGVSAAPLPTGDGYQPTDLKYQLIYRYDRTSDGGINLGSAAPLAAFAGGHFGHVGGGMLALPDGNLLFARGDLLDFDSDGLSAPQDQTSWNSRLLIIDAQDGDVTVAAQGLRNPQRITYTDATQTQLAISDIGADVAEEINVISLADVLDATDVKNFGWGRNADGNAREGTFYISPSPPGGNPSAVGRAPTPEAGFRQPFVQLGRDATPERWLAITGPVFSDTSFSTIEMLFGNLSLGELYATVASAATVNAPVYSVATVDETGAPFDIATLLGGAGGPRPDMRFFNFADGSAGMLLERQGRFYRINEFTSVVPLPATAWMLGLAALGLIGLRQTGKRWTAG